MPCPAMPLRPLRQEPGTTTPRPKAYTSHGTHRQKAARPFSRIPPVCHRTGTPDAVLIVVPKGTTVFQAPSAQSLRMVHSLRLFPALNSHRGIDPFPAGFDNRMVQAVLLLVPTWFALRGASSVREIRAGQNDRHETAGSVSPGRTEDFEPSFRKIRQVILGMRGRSM